MSKGVYTILDSQYGKQDCLLVATKLLKDRLADIYCKKRMRGIEEVKASVASMQECDPATYKELLSRACDPRPTLCDIEKTHDIFVHLTFRPHIALGFEYFKVQREGGGKILLTDSPTRNSIKFSLLGNNGNLITDMMVHIVLQAVGTSNDAPADAPRYKYCDLPAMRLCRRISFLIDEIIVDDYTSEDMLFDNQFRIDPLKRRGWNVGVGQEETHEGTYYMQDQRLTQVMFFRDGAQTPRAFQPRLELWLPLAFWFNLDTRQALHNQLIGTLQKNVVIDLAQMSQIIQTLDSNNNVIPNTFASFAIEKAELYTKNIYISPDVYDLFYDRTYLSLIRVHKRHTEVLNVDSDRILLSQLKYPIEIIDFGFRPNENDVGAGSFTRWTKMARVSTTEVPIPAIINNAAPPPPLQIVSRTATFTTLTPIITRLALEAFGNVIYGLTEEGFYNLSLPYVLPEYSTPSENGYYTMSFCHYPRKYQPSGHVNDSKTRELYLSYSGTGITQSAHATLYASARCINFLLYDKFTIRLKYIT